MRVTPEERRQIAQLAAQEERSAADAIRQLIRRAVNTEERADRKDRGALAVTSQA